MIALLAALAYLLVGLGLVVLVVCWLRRWALGETCPLEVIEAEHSHVVVRLQRVFDWSLDVPYLRP